jgi:hypothetical protein
MVAVVVAKVGNEIAVEVVASDVAFEMELILSSGHNFSEYQCYATKINKGRWVGKDAIFSKILFNFVA